MTPGKIDYEKQYSKLHGGTVSWEPYLKDGKGDRFGSEVFNLDQRFGVVDQTEAYASAIVHSDHNRKATLGEGRNRVLVRVGEKHGGGGFYFRLANQFGQPLSDKISYERPAKTD